MAPVCNAFIAILSMPLLVILFSFHALSSSLTPSFDKPITLAPANWTISLTDFPYQMVATKAYKIIFRKNFDLGGPAFAAGFYCIAPCNTYLFSVFITNLDGVGNDVIVSLPTEVVWSANRAHPVSENAILRLTSDSGLSLHDSDGSLVWSTNVSNHSVAGINITESGNLVLFDQNNSTIWQSFDHPTNTLVMGQKLAVGASLTANVSFQNWNEGPVHLTLVANGLRAFVDLNPPQVYFYYNLPGNTTESNPGYLKLTNGSIDMYLSFPNHDEPDGQIKLPNGSSESVQFIRLESDGHLNFYDYGYNVTVTDVLSSMRNMNGDIHGIPDSCGYPTICGHYGICQNGNCKCPNDTYFQEDRNSEGFTFSCSPLTSISCQDNKSHILLPLGNIAYFNYIDDNGAAFRGLGEEHCKEACLQNCSCKAAFFSYVTGRCYLPSEVFTLMNEEFNPGYFWVYNSSSYLKVQIPSPPPPPSSPQAPLISTTSTQPPPRKSPQNVGLGAILGSAFGCLFLLLFIIGTVWVLLRRGDEEEEQDYIDELPGLPTRFSVQELEVATENFGKKLGEGGFGTVFEGILGDLRVAVKRLEGVERAKKEFLAEVQIIGSIHHINLVRLIGFCAEKSKRFLVYEYMYNGSLDKWIFGGDGRIRLNWSTRYNIITNVAKGLCYLHEECRQRIVHLDIKPENILLDEDFNAKVADFGLCKLMDRDKSKVMTRMRGTPGYLAPEWLTAMITEKVDVYSFGVVVMEILCGRRNLDYSQTEENRHLITLLEVKSKSNELCDLIDKSIEDFEVHKEEIMHVMELAMWCLQSDCTKRPSMSVVVKVLEGAMQVETSLDYNFASSIPMIAAADIDVDQSVPLVASVLSGPR